MVLKKIKKKAAEDLEDEDEEQGMHEDEYLDEEDEEQEDDEKQIRDKDKQLDEIFKKATEARIGRIENAVTVNQKYIKRMWERQNKLEDDFKLLYESK